jgi:hypothetical protein
MGSMVLDACVLVRMIRSVAPYYQIWYRDSALFGQPETYNSTKAIGVPWGQYFICH